MLQFNSANLSDATFNASPVQQILFGGNVVWQRGGVRYIRWWVWGSSADGYSHLWEIQAWSNNTNVLAGKNAALYSSSGTFLKNSTLLTDGEYNAAGTYENNPFGQGGKGYALLDIGSAVKVDKIVEWHYWKDGRKYNTKTEVSPDGNTWKTVFDSTVNGTYAESSTGHTITL